MTKDNISAVRLMIAIDKKVTYQKIRTKLGFGEVTQQNVQAVEKLMQRNQRIAYVELKRELAIRPATMQTIIPDNLSLNNRCSRCVPHKLTDKQKPVE
ncbi:hypothetical protein EVAR_95251_1 [Eumeta japonica]|uniref:Uncharacterized protein n=1 Tax=Eumeta variegata TaxID=151549 RepID=A0A4C1UKR4_EUMVA|nr:hypothetical protein EVAR_95251_1 [Eumeta japonica]